MDPISIGLMAYGAIDSYMSKDDDPYAAQRREIQKALAELNSGKMADAIKLRGASMRNEATRMLMDKSAAAGLPQNATNQHLLSASIATGRETEGALAENEMNVLNQKARLLGMLPPEPEDNTGAQLLSLGIQGASTGAFKGMFGGKSDTVDPGLAGAKTGASERTEQAIGKNINLVPPSKTVPITTGGPLADSIRTETGKVTVPITTGWSGGLNKPAWHNANTRTWSADEQRENEEILRLLLGKY